MEALLVLLAQASEPFSFRFVVQPALALLLGLRDAKLDVQAGRRPFGAALFRGAESRRERLREAARAIAIPLLVATLLDALVQYLVREHRVYLWHAVAIGGLLIALPYVLARGLGNRAIARARRRRA